jgi:hypothetical protein
MTGPLGLFAAGNPLLRSWPSLSRLVIEPAQRLVPSGAADGLAAFRVLEAPAGLLGERGTVSPAGY